MLIVYNELNLLHKLSSKPHPQRPQRITQVIRFLKQTKYAQTICAYPNLINRLQLNDEQIHKITIQEIVKLHGQRYFDFIEGMWCEGISKQEMFINVDTFYMKDTFKAALEAVKTVILAIEFGLKEKKKDSICMIRPPGHHSGMKNQPHGFSFFNNVAIAANYFTSQAKKKAVIIDWDIHHGEGTQNLFYDRNDILYISLHRFDKGTFFPHVKQSGCQFVGDKSGKGFNINIAWNFPAKVKDEKRESSQTVRDVEYIYSFKNIIQPVLKQYDFEAIFISCGFDCAQGDPIGDSKISQKGFKYMTQALKSFGRQIYVVLQGGYNIDTLKWGIQSVAEGLDPLNIQINVPEVKFEELNQFAQKDIQMSLQAIKNYWKI